MTKLQTLEIFKSYLKQIDRDVLLTSTSSNFLFCLNLEGEDSKPTFCFMKQENKIMDSMRRLMDSEQRHIIHT